MTSSLGKSKSDQIDALTRGVQLPLLPIAHEFLVFIAERVAEAFREIEKLAPTTTGGGSEAEVTALLEARLNAQINIDPAWRQLVLCVVRGKESVSFDGTHIEKRPDLSIFLTDRNRNFPLVAEAKIIDGPTGKTTALYCDNGIRRFLTGQYAWAGGEAMMVAYVRDGASIASTLSPFLETPAAQGPAGYSIQQAPVAIASTQADLAHSRHERGFAYPSQSPPDDQPGPIALLHIWLAPI